MRIEGLVSILLLGEKKIVYIFRYSKVTIYELVFKLYCTHLERSEKKLPKRTTLRHSLGFLSAFSYLNREKLVTGLVIDMELRDVTVVDD